MAILDAGTDDGEVLLAGIVAELFKHAWLDDGVLIQRDEPFAAELLGLATELVQGRSDTKVLGVLYQDHAVGEGADISHVLRAVIDDEDRAMLEMIGSGLQVLLQSREIGLVGDNADGVFHIFSYLEKMPFSVLMMPV